LKNLDLRLETAPRFIPEAGRRAPSPQLGDAGGGGPRCG